MGYFCLINLDSKRALANNKIDDKGLEIQIIFAKLKSIKKIKEYCLVNDYISDADRIEIIKESDKKLKSIIEDYGYTKIYFKNSKEFIQFIITKKEKKEDDIY